MVYVVSPGAAGLFFLLFSLWLSVAGPWAGGVALLLCGSGEVPVLPESLESLTFIIGRFLSDHLVQPLALHTRMKSQK